MSVLTIALLQMTACGADQAANLAKGESFCRQAGAKGADIALFPEMWNIGYVLPEPDEPADRAAWLAQAISQDDPFITHFRALAKELRMAIALTYLELAAHATGLGACWAGYFHFACGSYKPLQEALSLPDGHQVHGAMMLGYPKHRFSRIPLRNAPAVIWR